MIMQKTRQDVYPLPVLAGLWKITRCSRATRYNAVGNNNMQQTRHDVSPLIGLGRQLPP